MAEFADAGFGVAVFAADLFAEFGEGCGEVEAGVATGLDEAAELFAGTATGLGGAGFGALGAAGSGATAASALGSAFFSGSFFFGTGEITIETT